MTTTFVSSGTLSRSLEIAVSSFFLSTLRLPAYSTSVSTKMSFGRICEYLLMMPSGPMSGAVEEKIAPMLPAARSRTTASIELVKIASHQKDGHQSAHCPKNIYMEWLLTSDPISSLHPSRLQSARVQSNHLSELYPGKMTPMSPSLTTGRDGDAIRVCHETS